MAKAVLEELKARFPDAVLATCSEHGDDAVVLRRESLLEVARYLKESPTCCFEMPLDVTAVDYRDYPEPKPCSERFEVVVHVRSLALKHWLRIKVAVPENDPVVASLMPVWKGVNWFEREVFDMFGIRFEGHPDLRRVLMYPEFVGHPLRKDYPLRGYQPPMEMPTLKGDPVPGLNRPAAPGDIVED